MEVAILSLPLVANYRLHNLKDLLVRSALRPQEPQGFKGTQPCRRPHCRTCTHIQTGNRFCSSTTKESFYAQTSTTCKTSNVIYLIECKKCQKEYMGEMENPFHLWMNGHRSDYYSRLPDKLVVVYLIHPTIHLTMDQ